MFIKPENFQAECTFVKRLSKKVLEFGFRVMDHKFEFMAGQFVMMNFDSLIDEQKNLSRAYSISSAPTENYFELCVEIVPGGQAGAYFSAMQEGDKVDFKGPFGVCSIKPENTNDLLMVATGTGIAPIKSILEDLAARGDTRQVDVYFGLRYEEDVFYETEVRELVAKFPNSKFVLTLSKPSSDWTGNRGRVTEYIIGKGFRENLDIYLCGNGNMIRDIRSEAIVEGVPKKQIHVEIFDS